MLSREDVARSKELNALRAVAVFNELKQELQFLSEDAADLARLARLGEVDSVAIMTLMKDLLKMSSELPVDLASLHARVRVDEALHLEVEISR